MFIRWNIKEDILMEMVTKIRLKNIRENYWEKGRVHGWMKILNITGRDISKCIG